MPERIGWKQKTVYVGISSLLVCSVSACTVFNPHVGADRSDILSSTSAWVANTDPASEKTNGNIVSHEVVTLREALVYAGRMQDAYREGLGDQSTLKNVTAVTLISLVAATTGFAVTSSGGVARDALAAGALGAAALYGSSLWLSSTPRQRVYIAGYKAISCAVEAIIPLNIKPKRVKDPLKGLNKKIVELDQNSGLLLEKNAVLRSIDKNDPLLSVAEETLAKAEATRNSASNAQAQGENLLSAIDQAGLQLYNTVDRISTLVDKAVLDTESELSTLPSILQGLGDLSGQLVQVPGSESTFAKLLRQRKSFADADEGTLSAAQKEVRTANGQLNLSISQVKQEARKVTVIIGSVNNKAQVEKLKNCGIEIDETVAGMTTEPTGDIELAHGEATFQAFSIKGGKPPFDLRFIGPTDGLTAVTLPTMFSPYVEVRSAGTAIAKDYTLKISDATLATTYLKVRVVATKPPALTGGAPEDGGSANLEKSALRGIQSILINASFGSEAMKTGDKVNDETTKALEEFAILVGYEAILKAYTDANKNNQEILGDILRPFTFASLAIPEKPTPEQRKEVFLIAAIEIILRKHAVGKPINGDNVQKEVLGVNPDGIFDDFEITYAAMLDIELKKDEITLEKLAELLKNLRENIEIKALENQVFTLSKTGEPKLKPLPGG